MRAFEIHTYTRGRWKIDSVFDDRELAVFEARRMDTSGRFAGVRVVEEVFDERAERSTTRTIYRGSKVADANRAELQKRSQIRHDAAQSRKKRSERIVERRKQIQKKNAKRQTNPYRIIAILSVLVIAALGALYGLQHIKELL